MKNLLLILGLTFLFACHTGSQEDQDKSGINDPTNIMYGDIDPSVLSSSAETAPVGEVPKAPEDTAAMVEVCIDSSKIDPDAMCTQEIAPVCGCDGKEYNNQCEAAKAGVTKFTEGPCPTKEKSKKKK